MTDDTATLGTTMEAALDAAASAHGTMITSYILVAQTISDDGSPELWVISRDDQPPWISLGLLDYAATLERRSAGVPLGGGDDG